MNSLQVYQGMKLISIDSTEAAADPLLNDVISTTGLSALTEEQASELAGWIQQTLGPDVVKQVNVSKRLVSYPAIGKSWVPILGDRDGAFLICSLCST